MTKQQSLSAYPSIDKILVLDTPLAYRHIGAFASKWCLVLERFLSIRDYRVPSSGLLEESISFFEKAKEEITYSNDPRNSKNISTAPELVSEVLGVMHSEGDIVERVLARDFCNNSGAVLRALIDDPQRVPRKEIQILYDFFSHLENTTSESCPNFIEINSATA